MPVRFQPNTRWAGQMRETPAVRRTLAGKAREALPIARRNAAEHRDTGGSERAIRVVGARLLTTHRAGHLAEYGGGNMPARAPLRRAAEAVGARYVDTGRGARG